MIIPKRKKTDSFFKDDALGHSHVMATNYYSTPLQETFHSTTYLFTQTWNLKARTWKSWNLLFQKFRAFSGFVQFRPSCSFSTLLSIWEPVSSQLVEVFAASSAKAYREEHCLTWSVWPGWEWSVGDVVDIDVYVFLFRSYTHVYDLSTLVGWTISKEITFYFLKIGFIR